MKISIIIVSYNTREVLDECISSIYSSTIGFPYEIIVVDNNSADGSVEMLQSNYPDVRIIKNSTNQLFAKANNQAAKIAQGEYILLLNSDTIVYDDNVQRLALFMDNQPQRVICCGPKILNKDKTIQSEGFPVSGIAERITMCFKLYKFLPSFLLPTGSPVKSNKPRETGWVAGCCMLIRKKEYLKIGGLNETMYFYGEEPEFGHRSRCRGYKTVYYPKSEIIHLGGVSAKKNVKIGGVF
jgi:GT2 family glycosyltransferase